MNKWCLLILLLEVLSLASCNNDDADIPIDISNIKTNEVLIRSEEKNITELAPTTSTNNNPPHCYKSVSLLREEGDASEICVLSFVCNIVGSNVTNGLAIHIFNRSEVDFESLKVRDTFELTKVGEGASEREIEASVSIYPSDKNSKTKMEMYAEGGRVTVVDNTPVGGRPMITLKIENLAFGFYTLSGTIQYEVYSDATWNRTDSAGSVLGGQPEFTSEEMEQNPRHSANYQTTVTMDGVEITRNGFGGINSIIFTDEDKSPASIEELFSQYLKLDIDENFILTEQSTNEQYSVAYEIYRQRYKGIMVYGNRYSVRLRNGRIISAGGSYMKPEELDGLNLTPSVSEQQAKEIYAKYLKVSVDKIGSGHLVPGFEDALLIADFPVSKGSSQWAPRLVYGLGCHEMNDEGYGLIDAHTGRILRTWVNYILN